METEVSIMVDLDPAPASFPTIEPCGPLSSMEPNYDPLIAESISKHWSDDDEFNPSPKDDSWFQRLSRLDDPEGDTWIFLNVVNACAEAQDSIAYDQYKSHYEEPMRMRSSLLRTASTQMAHDLFDETYQSRILRRLRNRGSITSPLPAGVHYLLDLSPPEVDEAAAYLVANLSCPEGIRFWHASQKIWAVPACLVAGVENYCVDGLADSLLIQRCGGPLPYTPLRYHTATERLLHGIQAQPDLQLDSAVKVWALASVAQYFGVSKSSAPKLFEVINSWIRTKPNDIFMEVNTEATLRIADIFQDKELARDAFAILVGEEALDASIRGSRKTAGRGLSAHGRRKEDLPEAYIQRVEYASRAFIERTERDFKELAAGNWLESLPCMRGLLTCSGLDEVDDRIAALVAILRAWITGSIYSTLFSDYDSVPEYATSRDSDTKILLPQRKNLDVIKSLAPMQRILTRTYWRGMHLQMMIAPNSLTSYESACGTDGGKFQVAATVYTAASEIYRESHRRIETDSLYRLARECDSLVRSNLDKLDPDFVKDLPERKHKYYDRKSDIYNDLATNTEILEEPNETLRPAVREPQKVLHLVDFFDQVKTHVHQFAKSRLAGSATGRHDRQNPYKCTLINTLTKLDPSEWKYLPLYAGGNDDETGAVFSSEITEASLDAAFSTAGPKIHTGSSTYSVSQDSSISSDDSFEHIHHAEVEEDRSAFSAHHTSLAVLDDRGSEDAGLCRSGGDADGLLDTQRSSRGDRTSASSESDYSLIERPTRLQRLRLGSGSTTGISAADGMVGVTHGQASLGNASCLRREQIDRVQKPWEERDYNDIFNDDEADESLFDSDSDAMTEKAGDDDDDKMV